MGSALSVVTARVSAAHAPSDKPPWQGETPPECLKRHPGALTSGDRDFRAFGVRIRRIIKRISLAEWQNIHQLSLTSHTLTFYSQNKLKPIHFYCTTYTKGRLGLCASNPSLILFCSTIPSIHFGFKILWATTPLLHTLLFLSELNKLFTGVGPTTTAIS